MASILSPQVKMTKSVVEGDIMSDGEPMTYAYYHLVKKGKAPKATPTYIEV